MRIVHVQTQIQTVFGVIDDDGNVVPQEPVAVQLQRFDRDTFVEAFTAIAAARDKALANGEEQDAAKNGSRTRPQRQSKATARRR